MKCVLFFVTVLACATQALVAKAAENDTMTLPQAQAAAKAERAKVAQHTAAIASAKTTLARADLTPQERKYASAMVEAQSRYLKEATSRALQAEGTITRLEAEAAQLAAAVHHENSAQAGVPLAEQKVAVNEPRKAATTTQALQVVTFKDGKTLEILRYMEVEDQYSLQTVDKKFKTVPKDSVQSIEDKKTAQ
jgi:hypothetical protein